MKGPQDSPVGSQDARISLRKRQYGMAAAFMVIAVGVLLLASGDDAVLFRALAAICVLLAGVLVYGASRYQNAGAVVNEVNRAYADFVAGREAEGEARLDALGPAARKSSYIRRAIELQRTALAMRRGKLEEAVDWATKVQEGKPRLATRLHESILIVEGRALRAVVQASLGRADLALADAKEVEASPLRSPSAVARASLSRALVLAKSERFEELQAHYAAEGEALVEELAPRERMLSRALRRLGQPRARSVYREVGIRDEQDDAGARDREWVRKIAPDAVRFVPRVASPESAESFVPYERPVAATRPGTVTARRPRVDPIVRGARRRNRGRRVALWLVFVVAFGGVWAFLQPAQHSHGGAAARAPSASMDPALVGLAAVLGFIGFFVALVAGIVLTRVYRQRRWVRAFQGAQLRLLRDDDPEAQAELENLAQNGDGHFGPPSNLAVARYALRRGDAAAALAATANGMEQARASLATKAAHQDIVLPELLSQHAFAGAVDGRQQDAEADLDQLERDYPVFPFRARAAYRVNLLGAIKRGDLATAARIVAGREPEMSVELRIDLLGEVASAAATGGLHDEAAEALRSELAAMPRAAAWIEKVAPGLTARIGRAHAVRVATPFMSYDDDTRPLGEEAAQLLALGARRPRS